MYSSDADLKKKKPQTQKAHLSGITGLWLLHTKKTMTSQDNTRHFKFPRAYLSFFPCGLNLQSIQPKPWPWP